MVLFFKGESAQILAVQAMKQMTAEDIKKLEWLFSGASRIESEKIDGFFVGPRREMITPWSTNAVEITQNMGLEGILRIEAYF
mgnify:CR=1 FL=1